jgi:hypothetical protein
MDKAIIRIRSGYMETYFKCHFCEGPLFFARAYTVKCHSKMLRLGSASHFCIMLNAPMARVYDNGLIPRVSEFLEIIHSQFEINWHIVTSPQFSTAAACYFIRRKVFPGPIACILFGSHHFFSCL